MSQKVEENPISKKGKNAKRTRTIAGCGVLTAVAAVLQFWEVAIPVVPSFIKLDFSDLPAILGAFAYGPLAGVLIELLKNIIHLPFSSSATIGELSNFILGAVFTGVAGYVYKQRKTIVNAIVGGVSGAIAMGLISIVTNFFIIYPLYYSVLHFPEPAVLEMYQAIRPSTSSVAEALIVFNFPFTVVKGLVSVVVTMLIYQPLRPFLKGKNK